MNNQTLGFSLDSYRERWTQNKAELFVMNMKKELSYDS